MDVSRESAVCPPPVRSVEVVRVPVKTILYVQAMAENGRGDRPKPLGPTLPCDQVCYRQ
jgi:hypothetical protein